MTSTQLKRLLNAAELSQAEAARQLDLDPRSMRRYIAGDVEIPRVVGIAIQAITDTWNPTLELRARNLHLREVGLFAERELKRIADGVVDSRRVARNALDKITAMRGRKS
jgi:hypothetical protein